MGKVLISNNIRKLRFNHDEMTQQQLAELDSTFGLNTSGNSEIVTQWFLIAIANDYPKVYKPLGEFKKTVGRRKFLKPLYEALAKTEKGKVFAREIYKTARAGYHPVSYQTIDAILK